MRELLILEDELEDLGAWDTLTIFFSSLASFFFSYSLSVFTILQVEENLSDNAEGFIYFALFAGLVLGVLFGIAAVLMWLRRKSKIETIKRQSINLPQSPTPASAPTQLDSDTASPQPRQGP